MPFFSRKSRGDRAVCHAVPAGQRVYAIGDVHGCAAELEVLLARINADHAARPPAERLLVFLGDLVDRGPDSAGVVRRVRELCEAGEARWLKGNHEELLLLAALGDRRAARLLMEVGGVETLASYGIPPEESAQGSFADLIALMREHIPGEDLAFLGSGEDMIMIGDYLFVHAGIRPGVPTAEQVGEDLRWIRRPFLESRADHGKMVVHGHTITERIDEQPNRIGIDTGAFATGRLSALGLEGTERWTIDSA